MNITKYPDKISGQWLVGIQFHQDIFMYHGLSNKTVSLV